MLLELGLSEVSSALLAGVVSFQPMLTFITSSINIDAFLLAAFGLLLFGAVRFLGRGADIIGVSCLLAGTVISLFSKPPGYFSLGLIIFLLVLFFISRAKGYLKMEFWQKTVLGASFFIFIVAFSWLFYHLYQAIKVRYFPGSQSLSLLPAYLRHQFDYNVFYAHSTFYWGNFGWLDTPFSQPMIWVIWAILALGITGIIYFFGKNIYRWKKLSKKEKVFNYQVLFLALIVLGFNFMIHAVNFQQVNPNNVADESGAIAIQGRYFFPVIGVKFFLIFWGLTALLSQIYKKIKLETGAFILFLGGVILNFIGLFVYLVPRFYLNDGTTYFSQELLDRMSQYKPIMLKEWVIVFVLIVFLALIAKFLYLAYCRIRSNSK
ncbi:MAG: hypothetical protein FJZ04_03830 [Candidatus Moranbacteria bacterium]|nr:hypothetical protein [Candidatus Moranbacteria bacterium]